MSQPEPATVVVPLGIQKIDDLMCRCGAAQLAWQCVRDYLHHFSLSDYDQRTLKLETGEQYFLAYALDSLGLAEHGSGVAGGWLTDEGGESLAFLEKYGTEWYDRTDVEFVDPQGTSRSSLH